MPDIRIQTFGVVALLTGLTPAGHLWLLRNVSVEPGQWLGGAVVVEMCIAEGVYDGARGDGLEVELRNVL